jgi:hypothetical protein
MTLKFVVSEVTPIAYEAPDVQEVGRFDSLDAAVAAARTVVPEPAHSVYGESFPRIEVEGWKA